MRRLQARKNAQSALNNNVVWYNTLEDVTNMLETEDGKKLNVVKDSNNNPVCNRSSIVIVKEGDNYLRVLGNTWTTEKTNRPAIKKNGTQRKNKDNKLLYMTSSGLYGFVKGSIEDEETDMAAARREMREETGLDLPDASFVFNKYFTMNRDPRPNPLYTATVTPEQRTAITTELNKRNTEDKGEIFGHEWVPLATFNNVKLNSTSKIVYDELIRDPRMQVGGKTRRLKSKKRKTYRKKYFKMGLLKF